jgi:hypothetical protein
MVRVNESLCVGKWKCDRSVTLLSYYIGSEPGIIW